MYSGCPAGRRSSVSTSTLFLRRESVFGNELMTGFLNQGANPLTVAKAYQGFQDEGLKSMKYEGYALAVGGGIFVAGFLLERRIGAR